MPRGDESYRLSLYYKALSSTLRVGSLSSVKGDNCDLWPHTKAMFSKKKSPIRRACHLHSASLSCSLGVRIPGAVYHLLLLLRLLWHTERAPSFSLLFALWDTERPLKTPITHHGFFVVVSLSLRKLNSDFFRSTMAVGCTHCRHIVAVDEKTQRGPLMSFQQKSTRCI